MFLSGDEEGVHAEKNTREPFLRVRGARVLELGAGCGLDGLAAATVSATEVVLTEGAPGALAALVRSAEAECCGESNLGLESAAGSRTPVSRVRVSYDNHLHYREP